MEALREPEFIDRLLKGEREAFDTLVRQCHGSVYRLAMRMLGHSDDAQEVAQETFLSAYQGIAKFREEANIRTWLLAIAYRKSIDWLKKRNHDQLHLSENLEEFLEKRTNNVSLVTEWWKNPEYYYSNNEVSELIRDALGEVPAESRAVFELRDIQGLSSKEAAETLGLSEGALRVRLHRVRQYLMLQLGDVLGKAVANQ